MRMTELKTLAVFGGAMLLTMTGGVGASLACCKTQFERTKPHMNYSPPPHPPASLPKDQKQPAPPMAQPVAGAAAKPGGMAVSDVK